jgi:uncharacterized protein (TIGR03437 family)
MCQMRLQMLLSAFLSCAFAGVLARAETPAHSRDASGSSGVWQSFTAEGVVNAASFLGGAVAAGEIVTIFGTAIGPDSLRQLELSGDKVNTQLAGVQVLFDGVPAPLIYVSRQQLSAVVPYAVHGRNSTAIQIDYQGSRSPAVNLPVAASAPGIFALDATGRGQAAALNEDTTINSVPAPAAPGSVAVFYATGEGQTSPAGSDGQLALTTLPEPLLPVTVSIEGREADVLYAGAAPLLVAGVLQVNARVPAGLDGGPAVPVRIKVGQQSSQEGITLAVRSSIGNPPPGGRAVLTGTSVAANPDLAASVGADDLRPFEIVDASGRQVFGGELQDRTLTRTSTGNLTFSPRLRQLTDFGSGAVIVRLDVKGFAAVTVDTNFRTDGNGNLGPSAVERSADADRLSFLFDPPIDPPQESFFLSIVTDVKAYGQTGETAIYARMPDGRVHSTTVEFTNAPR